MERGYIKLYRKALDSGLIQHAKAWQLLSWLLLSVTHKPFKTTFNGVLFSLEPGQLVSSMNEICARLKMTPKEYRTAVAFLEKAEFAANKGANRGTVFTIINWDTYQQEGQTEGKPKGKMWASSGQTEGVASRNIQEQENKKKESKKVSKAEPKPKQKSFDSLVDEYTQDPELRRAFSDFIVMRNKAKLPFTNAALERTFHDLNRISQDNHIKAEILWQSVQRGWCGVFPLKENNFAPPPRQGPSPHGNVTKTGEERRYEQPELPEWAKEAQNAIS